MDVEHVKKIWNPTFSLSGVRFFTHTQSEYDRGPEKFTFLRTPPQSGPQDRTQNGTWAAQSLASETVARIRAQSTWRHILSFPLRESGRKAPEGWGE